MGHSWNLPDFEKKVKVPHYRRQRDNPKNFAFCIIIKSSFFTDGSP